MTSEFVVTTVMAQVVLGLEYVDDPHEVCRILCRLGEWLETTPGVRDLLIEREELRRLLGACVVQGRAAGLVRSLPPSRCSSRKNSES